MNNILVTIFFCPFNKGQLDTSNWDYELGSIRGVEQEHYVNDPENVYVKDGQLVL